MADTLASASSKVGVLSKSIHSGKWMLFGMILQKALNLGTFFVLARMLKPSDYGVIAIIFIVTGLIDRFTSHGFEMALIQSRGEIEGYLDDIWTINVLKSVGILVLIYVFAQPISDFFNAGEYYYIIGLGGLFVLLPNLASARQIFLSKNLEFKKLFIRDAVGQFAYTFVAIYWALYIDASLWALFFGHTARLFSTVTMSYVLYPAIPALSFKFRKLKSLMGYSKWVMGKGFFDYFLNAIDSIYVGRFLDPGSLGFYSRASNLSSTVTAPITSIFTKIGFPAYSKLQDDLGKIQEGFLKSFNLLMTAALPASFILIIEGGPLVQFLLGAKWGGIVLPLKILSAAAIIFALARMVFPIFDGLGRPDINFRSNLLQLILSLVFIYFGTRIYGAAGAAWAMLMVSIAVLFYVVLKARPVLKMGKDKFIAPVLTVGFSIFVILVLEIPFRLIFRGSLGNVSIFIWTVFLGFVYFAAVWWSGKGLKSGPWHTLMVIFNEIKSDFK